MKVTVQLFAIARESAGADRVEVELREPATVSALRQRLAADFPPLRGVLEQSRIAVDGSFADGADMIQPGAEVACIPPVSGG